MYLETLGGQIEYTRHVVGFTSDKNPYIIFMNDFIIQMYENELETNYVDIYGLQKASDYRCDLNMNENEFIIQIVSNEDRKEYIRQIPNEQMLKMVEMYKSLIGSVWMHIFNSNIPEEVLNDFFVELRGQNDFLATKFSRKEMHNLITSFILKYTKSI